jgi:hypothetical protein
VRRIAKVVGEQIALYGTLTGVPAPARPAPSVDPETVSSEPMADVVPLPRRDSDDGVARGSR